MTDEQKDALWGDYIAREKAANAKPQGADHKAILQAVADDHGVAYEVARGVILDRTVIGGAG